MADAADSTPALSGQFALTVADLNTNVNHEPRIEDIRLAEALGMEHPREIRRLIERHREALERFGEVCVTVTQTSRKGGRPGRTSWLNQRHCLYLCTKSEAACATEATIQMVEVFNAHLAGRLTPPRAAPAPLPFLPGEEPLVSSRDVAGALGRRHTAVLRALDVLAAERPALLGAHIRFATYPHENGRPYRCFHLTRAGFQALMMRLSAADPSVAALRDATLPGWPDAIFPPPAPPPGGGLDRDGLALVRVDGETLRVDLLNIDLVPSARVLVFDHAGRVSVERLARLEQLDQLYGRRATLAYRAAEAEDRTDRSGRPIVWAVGMVVEAGDVAMPEPDAGEAPRRAKPVRRRDAARALAAAPPAALNLATLDHRGSA